MGRLVMLAENVFNPRLFPAHALSAVSEAADPVNPHDVEVIASGRRQRSENYWTPTALNTAAWVRSSFNRVRVVDMVALDRGHNLAGKTVRVQASSDGFLTYSERSALIPSSVFPYSRLSQTNGIRTPEGAWLYRFLALSGTSVRFYIDAMGANLRPEIVGLYLGLSFRATNPVIKPSSHGRRQLDYEVIKAPSMWAGAGQVSQRKNLPINLRLEDGDYPSAVYHWEELFMRARPSWVVPDDEQAEKAYLSRAEPQEAGFEVPAGKSQWEATFIAPEHEPLAA